MDGRVVKGEKFRKTPRSAGLLSVEPIQRRDMVMKRESVCVSIRQENQLNK